MLHNSWYPHQKPTLWQFGMRVCFQVSRHLAHLYNLPVYTESSNLDHNMQCIQSFRIYIQDSHEANRTHTSFVWRMQWDVHIPKMHLETAWFEQQKQIALYEEGFSLGGFLRQ